MMSPDVRKTSLPSHTTTAMTEPQPEDPSRLRLRRQALSRWENEGGATDRPSESPLASRMPSDHPELSNAELVQMRVRVIALENVVIALLTQADESALQRVREMAAYISPRPGYTHHPLTLMAAGQMISLVDRAASYRSPSEG